MQELKELEEGPIRAKLTRALSKYDEEHPEVALLYMDLGDCYEIQGQFLDAERYYQRAADIFHQLGLDHELLLAIAIKSAAEMARIQDRLEDAKKLKARARGLVKAYCDRDFGISPDEPGPEAA